MGGDDDRRSSSSLMEGRGGDHTSEGGASQEGRSDGFPSTVAFSGLRAKRRSKERRVIDQWLFPQAKASNARALTIPRTPGLVASWPPLCAVVAPSTFLAKRKFN